MRRRLLAGLAVAAVLLAGWWTLATNAEAAPAPIRAVLTACVNPLPFGPCVNVPTPGDCKPSPTPRYSGMGISAMFDGKPADTNGQPAQTIYEKYGVHPFSFSVYDPGCAGSLDPSTWTWYADTYVGNMLLGGATDLVALGNGVHNLVFHPTWLSVFDRLEVDGVNGLRDHVWNVLLPLSMLILAISLMIDSRKGDTARALKKIGIAIFCVLLGGILMAKPLDVGKAADSFETGLTSDITSAIAGQAGTSTNAVANVEVDDGLYPAWLEGEVGSSSSQTAVTYGPYLLDGSAYTWQEMATGSVSSSVTNQKAAEWAAAASGIQSHDPAAYDQLKGANAPSRTGAGIVALGGVIVTVPFRLASDLLILAAMLILRLAVVFAPVLLVIGLHERFFGIVKQTGRMVFAALVNAVLFSVLSALFVVASAQLLGPSSGIPQWQGLVLLLALGLLLWFLSRPLRSLHSMVRPDEISPLPAVVGLVSSGVDKVKSAVKSGGEVAVAGATGGAAGAAAVAGEMAASDKDTTPESRPTHTKEPTMPIPEDEIDDPLAPTEAFHPTVSVPEAAPADPNLHVADAELAEDEVDDEPAPAHADDEPAGYGHYTIAPTEDDGDDNTSLDPEPFHPTVVPDTPEPFRPEDLPDLPDYEDDDNPLAPPGVEEGVGA